MNRSLIPHRSARPPAPNPPDCDASSGFANGSPTSGPGRSSNPPRPRESISWFGFTPDSIFTAITASPISSHRGSRNAVSHFLGLGLGLERRRSGQPLECSSVAGPNEGTVAAGAFSLPRPNPASRAAPGPMERRLRPLSGKLLAGGCRPPHRAGADRGHRALARALAELVATTGPPRAAPQIPPAHFISALVTGCWCNRQRRKRPVRRTKVPVSRVFPLVLLPRASDKGRRAYF